MRIREASAQDVDDLAALRAALWPEGSVPEHRAEVSALLAGEQVSTMPLVIFVAEHDGRLAGFVEVGLRSHADGCDPRWPCGFLEGLYVVPDQRRRGVGRSLVARAEQWALAQGCRELASDTWIDNVESQAAHRALGFAVVDRCVNFKKSL